jgi:mono/diheme cytochrome c family protein
MRHRHRRKRILSFIGWNALVWLCGAHLSGGLAAQVAASAQSDQQAQIEKGRQTVGQACVACHTNILRMLQVHKKSEEQWRDTVYSMIGRGAQIMPDEIQPLTAFLTANAGTNGSTNTQASRAGRAGRADQQGPEGEGRAILQRTCQQCHDLATAQNKLPSEDWNAVIAKMMMYGARLSPEDQQTLAGYLNGLAK